MAKRNEKKFQPADRDKSTKPVRERKPRRAVDRTIGEWRTRLQERGVHEAILGLAIVTVQMVEMHLQLFAFLKQRALVGATSFDMVNWEKLYRDPLALGQTIRRVLLQNGGVFGELAKLSVAFEQKFFSMSIEERRQWIETNLRGASLRQLDLGPIGNALREQFFANPEIVTSAKVENADQRLIPEGQFFISVYLPAMLLLKTSPTELLRHAESGDLRAVCELISLDPFAVHLPTIAQFKLELTRGNCTAELAAIRQAEAETIDVPNGRAAYKEQMAAELIGASRLWAKAIGKERGCFEKRDLWNLFDLVAKARGLGNDSNDLHSFGAFQKGVSRRKPQLAKARWDIFPA